MDQISTMTSNLLIIEQIAGAVSPFIVSYLFYRYMKALRLRMAMKYFEEVKASEYWPDINKRKFMQESEIYAYDFEELVTPGEHFLHPCIRGLRERQMYEELPGLERIRKKYCWTVRMVGMAWVVSFFAAFYFSAIVLETLGDTTGNLIFALKTSAMFITPICAMYFGYLIPRKDQIRIVQEYYHQLKNGKYWKGIVNQDFMQNIQKTDPELERFGTPASPHSGLTSERSFITPIQIHFMEQQMYEELSGLKKVYEKYHRAFRRRSWISFFVGFASAIFSIMVLDKIGDATGVLLRLP